MAYKSKKSQTLREGNPEKDSQIYFLQPAGVAELVDARDLKSLGLQRLCGFDSRPPHHIPKQLGCICRHELNPFQILGSSRLMKNVLAASDQVDGVL